jgi:GNAT superfamily N-acetyltransferase
MTSFTLSTDKSSITPEEAIELFALAGWGKHEEYDAVSTARAIENTSFIVSARSLHGELIGMTRVFSDGVFFTTVADIVVHPEHRKLGVGSAMMGAVRQEFGTTGIFLDALAEAGEFFAKCGYRKRPMEVYARKFE